MQRIFDRIRHTPPAELVLWGSILFIVVLLATTGQFLFRSPAPITETVAPGSGTAVPERGLLAGSTVPALATTPLPSDTLPPSPTKRPTMLPLALPEVTPPPGGQILVITPAPNAGGWVRQGDETPNHLGDYNIYAGVFDDQVYIGAIQFDLSDVPAGTPINYADLTLVGLSDQWLGSQGTWVVDLLEPWMDTDWQQKDFGALQRPDGAVLTLTPPLTAGDLATGGANTLVFGSQAVEALRARTFDGQISFRVRGPASGPNNLFTWDSGYGTGSLGQIPILRLVVGPAPATPPPSPTPRYVIITGVPPTPTPQNVLTLAARLMTATAEATPYTGTGTPTPTHTPTPLPPDWVTPVVIVHTATPANAATTQWHAKVATAAAFVYGTPTPWPPNAWTATPAFTPTPRPLLIPLDQMTPAATGTPTPVATPTPAELPALLRGKIAFLSDRLGEPAVFVMDPDGSHVALLTDRWAYNRALELDAYSPDRSQRLFVKQYRGTYEIWGQNVADGWTWYLTGAGRITYDPAWSPGGGNIAYVGQADGNDEIFVIDKDTGQEERLTNNQWEWDKHPSWSPDATRIVFWSNREMGHAQIWVIKADGTDAVNISRNEFNETDPVWMK
ncbi:MAG: TolB family protein [Anaerolineae bacterium]